MKHIVITIGREYGSGGRLIAKKLADQMDITFYDKQLISDVAKKTGFSEQFIRNSEHQRPTNSFLYDLYTSVQTPSVPDQVFIAQAKVIKEAVQKGPCVIVGRCADYILRDHPHCLKVFITALCTILFSLFHWPCSTTCLTIAKETRSVKWTLLAMAIPTGLGMGMCMGVTFFARVLGLT